jgi:hypothetical protein
VGVPVTDPYIPMVATTEEQVEDLAYGAVYAILERAPIMDDYDVGLERILHNGRRGRSRRSPRRRPHATVRARRSSTSMRRTCSRERLKEAHATMMRNLAEAVRRRSVVARDDDDVRAG